MHMDTYDSKSCRIDYNGDSDSDFVVITNADIINNTEEKVYVVVTIGQLKKSYYTIDEGVTQVTISDNKRGSSITVSKNDVEKFLKRILIDKIVKDLEENDYITTLEVASVLGIK